MNKFALDSRFDNVPYSVIKEAFNTLKAYGHTTIRYENGKYTEGPHASVKATYAEDFKVIGDIYKSDVYTEIEQIENYINEFRAYPTQYKGKRDYEILNTMDKEAGICGRPYGRINEDGDFELCGYESI